RDASLTFVVRQISGSGLGYTACQTPSGGIINMAGSSAPHAYRRGFMKVSATFLSILFLCYSCFLSAAPAIQPFPLADVRLLDSPFKQAEQTNLQYLLAM